MTNRIILKRGSNTQNDSYTGVIGELTYDTTHGTLRVFDGVSLGGSRIVKSSDLSNYTNTSVLQTNYPNNTQLSSNLANYTNTTQFSTQLSSNLANYTNTSVLQTNYPNTTQLSSNLANYTNTSILQTNYPNTTQLSSNLANYTNTSVLQTNYPNTTQLSSNLANYAAYASNAIFTKTVVANSFIETKATVSANNIDLSTGNYFTKTISSNVSFTVSNIPNSGNVASFILDISNGGSATISWMANTKWASGIAPLLTSSGRDTLGFFTYDGGVTWSGFLLGKDMK